MPSIKFSHIASTYNKYLDSLYAYALHLGFDEESAMDAIHDLFYKLCTKHASLDEIQNLKFYLFRSLRNRLIDHKRSTREFTGSSIPIHAHSRLQVENDSANPLPFHLNVTVEDELIQKEDAEEIRQKVENVLNRLTDRQREVIYLHYIQECSYEEISKIMQISVAASRNLVSKSIVKLRAASLTMALFLLVIT
ncbi:MAG TPA: sigma-70 family RNA polymerase sigma factor [Petrimonas sp.]|mgnify:CR=1 FL=1|jgi:RNA polymerase sigma factor (sigma-70 family)|nr:sigma-70 family RNA polymerase sigma factor [Petrimonas sp.]